MKKFNEMYENIMYGINKNNLISDYIEDLKKKGFTLISDEGKLNKTHNMTFQNIKTSQYVELDRRAGDPSNEYQITWYKDKDMKIKHREDGPASLLPNGSTAWYFDGKLHRDGGPAIDDTRGFVQYYKHGKLHREDGPALDYAGGRHQVDPQGLKGYYLDGKELSKVEFDAVIKAKSK